MKIVDVEQITFNLEGTLDKNCAFFALYAGLRMYEDYKRKEWTDQIRDNPGYVVRMSLAYLNTMFLLDQLKENYPQDYIEAEIEYELKIKE